MSREPGDGGLPPLPEHPFGEGAPDRATLLRAAAGLAAASPGPYVVTTTDRAVLATAVVAVLSHDRLAVLAAADDGHVSHLLAGASPGGQEIGAGEPDARLAGWARRAPPELRPPDPAAGALAGPGGRVVVRLLTGGTTGNPRLFGKTAGNLLGEVALFRERFSISARDAVLATVSPLHIFGFIHSLLVPLLGGARMARATPLLPAEVEREAGRIAATVLVSAPPHLRVLATGRVRLPGIRLVLSSGSPLPEATASAAERLLGAPVVEIYGSTESGAVATRCRAAGEAHFHPLPPVACRVDGDGLRVRSPFLSVDLPLDGDGAYRMPDRIAPEDGGGFSLHGRVDDVVKIAGRRVDLGDLEQRLRALPGVDDVAVQAVAVASLREADLGVLVVTRADLPGVRVRVGEALRSIARPRWVLPVAEIPRTGAGKIDRRAVQALLRAAPGRE